MVGHHDDVDPVTVGEAVDAIQQLFQRGIDADLGRQSARRHARDKMWQLEGYLLREQLTSMAAQKEPDA